jgi:hydroxymethylglutaryl-CoA reductase
MLGNPTASELMGIAACTGLAQNFAAIRSLITTGIQYGHMKMHLDNILNHLNASPEEVQLAVAHFESRSISFNSVRNYLEELRCLKTPARKI